MKTKFINCTVITNDNNLILKNTCIVVEDDRILCVGQNFDGQVDNVIDVQNNIVMPGFVSFGSNISATFGDGDYLNNLDKYIKLLIQSGVTCFYDKNLNSSHIDALNKYGIRSFLNYDKNNINIDLKNNLISYVLLNDFSYDITDVQAIDLFKKSKEHNLPIVNFTSQLLTDMGECSVKYDMSPIQMLESIGFFEFKNILVGCNFIEKDDINLIAMYDCMVSSSAVNSICNGTLISPYYNLINKNVSTCFNIGDCNYIPNMFNEMFLTKNISQSYLGQINSIDNFDLLKSSSTNLYEFLNINNGKIVNNYLADMIIVNKHNFISDDVINNVINFGNCTDVLYTIINGKIVYQKDK